MSVTVTQHAWTQLFDGPVLLRATLTALAGDVSVPPNLYTNVTYVVTVYFPTVADFESKTISALNAQVIAQFQAHAPDLQ
ncbi:hypothetical protein F1536_12365 [Achromobacter xylosoxidans]|jgi:hypothetical protein|uniref:hypothetical protein n=1 Tax=Alcaligenes xylosoxydans xylosoxydans TaxID=85698 RepID=UPI000DD13735|nr:hypothetical protein [Achromobacter xylosoxidans]AXA79063.1 hypothetical protein CE206_22760 [Achromobacter xylosoxidans]KAA5926341.1 hypothetical protein F1536_12365 [Achromobacter xylosoxidans]QEQ24734.1 hypothetical protein F0U64_21370 [Achromobacter xylosoxidans]